MIFNFHKKYHFTFSVFEQKGSYNFDSFMKAPSTPSKGRPNKSKSVMGKQEWSTLSLPQQYEILHRVANEHTQVTLNFEALNMALRSSLASAALRKAFSLDKDTAETQDDPDERAYLLELLEEQAERSESIIQAEDQRFNKEMELLAAKTELAREFSALQEQYSLLLDGEPDFPAAPAKRSKQHKASKDAMEEKLETLKMEENRLVQMKTMIQKLLLADPNGCLNTDKEDMKSRIEEMLVKSGQDLLTLRQENKS